VAPVVIVVCASIELAFIIFGLLRRFSELLSLFSTDQFQGRRLNLFRMGVLILSAGDWDKMILLLIVSSFVSLITSYLWILPPHVRKLHLGRRYVVPPGPSGRPVVGSLPAWLRARNGGKMVPWVRPTTDLRLPTS